jgi:hypothetical protein
METSIQLPKIMRNAGRKQNEVSSISIRELDLIINEFADGPKIMKMKPYRLPEIAPEAAWGPPPRGKKYRN